MNRNIMDGFLQAVWLTEYEPISTGIDLLDRAIGGGLIRGSLVLLEGEPGVGKTALATQIFEHLARTKDGNCLYFALDMDVNHIIARGISRLMYLDGSAEITALEVLKGYQFATEQRKAIHAAALEYQEHIVDVDGIDYNPGDTGANLDKILSYIETETIRRKAARAAIEDMPFVVIDSLQSVAGEVGERQDDIIKRAVYSLKSYAVRHNSIVFVVAGRNAVRDAPVLEYSADLHILLADDEEDGPPKVETLYVEKNRFKANDVCKEMGLKLAFLGGQSLFLPLAQWLKRRAAKAKPAAKSKKDASKEE